MKESELSSKNALFKLAFFEPNFKDNDDVQILEHLILDCLANYGPILDCNAKEISDYIKKTFLLDFDQAEIIKGASRLEQNNLITKTKSESTFESPRYRFIENDKFNQKKKVDEIQTLEDLVMSEWSDILRDKYKKILTPVKTEKIIEAFKQFLIKLFVRHGKESVSMLYPESDKTKEWIDSIQMEIIKELPSLDKELDIILQIEIPIFFRGTQPHRIRYLNNLFNASFLWHLIQIDDSCTEYFKKTTEGQILVLDNNILFSLLGLHGNQILISIHNLLKYANELKYKLIVTTKTLDEFFESIKRNCEKAYDFPTYTKDIAKAAIAALDSSNFLVSYWKEFVSQGLTLEEFAIEKSHLDAILSGLNITVSNDFREEIEKSQELLDEESLLRSSCGENLNQSIIEHDAYHCVFIKKIRNGYKYKYSEAGAWFLTHDSKLPVYAHFRLKGKKVLPFCISTNEWIQINRPFIRRTQDAEEFEQSFQILVMQPYLRSIINNFKVDKIKEKILLRLNRYNNMGTQLAFEMATDVHFLLTLAKENNDKIIDQKIDSFIVDINQGLKSENKELYTLIEQETSKKKEEIDKLKVSIEEIRSELVSKSETLESLHADMAKLRKDLSFSKSSSDTFLSESERYKEKLKSLKKRMKWGIFIILLIPTAFFIWRINHILTATWIEELKHLVILKIVLTLIVLFSLLNIPIKKQWKFWLGLDIALLIALFTILCS